MWQEVGRFLDTVDPQGELHMASWMTAIGLVFATIFAADTSLPVWLLFAGIALVFLSVPVNIHAIGRLRTESRAEDWIEWKREEQRFRRGAGKIWRSIESAYEIYQDHRDISHSVDEFIDKAGLPHNPGPTASEMKRFMDLLFGLDDPVPMDSWSWPYTYDGGSETLIDRLSDPKEVLEVWSGALAAGGSKATSLQEVIVSMRSEHERTLRLMWHLSRAHAAYADTPGDPDFSFIDNVWRVMIE